MGYIAPTPMERTGLSGLRRNAALVMGNSKDPRHSPVLERTAADADPVVAEQARWSLVRLRAPLALGAWLLAAPLSANPGRDPGQHVPNPAPEYPVPGIPPQPTAPRQIKKDEEPPAWPLRLILVPMRRGMFIRLPVVDTDPNRGITYGLMPIWVVKERDSDRIEHIHAPSLTYNKIFKLNPTYRYYFYPTKDSTLSIRGAFSSLTDREALGLFEDYDFLGRGYIFGLKVQYNIDGSGRFFGLGPLTQKTSEANYLRDTLQYYAAFGMPLNGGSDWNIIASHHLAAEKISDGPINAVPDINAAFPGAAPFHRHQDSELRLTAGYDSRDSPITTTRGTLLELYGETSQRPLASEYSFQRYGWDFRRFHKHREDGKFVLAGRFRYEQITGGAPFWLMPQLGGKYIHRAYGDGRYIDSGVITTSVEERISVFKAAVSGVVTEYEVAPFGGIGTVFPEPSRMARRAFRPVYGVAFRAVARPQVVGSIDFGIGQEGLTVFMDINYSF